MKQRAITTAMIILGMTAVLFISSTVAYPIVLSLISFLATYEVIKVLALHKRLFVAIPSYLVAISMPIVAYLMRGTPMNFVNIIALVMFSFMMYLFTVAVFEKGRMPFAEFASAFAMVTYVVVSFSAMSLVRHFEGIGLYCLGIILISACITDVFAYLTGYFFGKHKLIPEVSPKKTIEGSV
jgi:phosphatidate cytidylyltransferase